MFIRFDTIHKRDRQTDGRTLHDSIGRTYAQHCAAKIQDNRITFPLSLTLSDRAFYSKFLASVNVIQ